MVPRTQTSPINTLVLKLLREINTSFDIYYLSLEFCSKNHYCTYLLSLISIIQFLDICFVFNIVNEVNTKE